MNRPDPHSYYDPAQPRAAALALHLDVDFARRVLSGAATLSFETAVSGPLDLDTKGLEIARAATGDGRAVPFDLAPEEPILGRRLRLTLPAGTREVTVAYTTSPQAIALQWLEPEQTAGKAHPFLFSQCQSIHARTMVPLQDTPIARVPYTAEITVPDPLVAVMSAGTAGRKDGPRVGTTTYLFEMPQPIPPYLLALAVGNLAARDLDPRSRVWAEPETVDAAAWEFAEIGPILDTAEKLFGPYDWDRYDMLVLPPSFPYGGMENPRLTFLTPTLLAGDRSLVDVVAHELAHSWTGNLITNASADHFWLNEGFTVWAERRILEALHGPDVAALGWAIGQRSLEEAIARFGADSPLTKLRCDLTGVDPDDSYSQVPYEKGARFVARLEQALGREKFDRFLRAYIERFRFTSITTEQFLAFLEERAPGLAGRVDARTWLYGVGLPADAPTFRSEALEKLQRLAAEWNAGTRPSPEEVAHWSPNELLIYLQNVPRPLPTNQLDWLDKTFHLTARGNYELLVEWVAIAASSDYEPVFPRVREVLSTVGRMKYLRPLYAALGATPRTRAVAREIFAAVAPRYHTLSRRVVESVMSKYAAD